MPGSVNVREYGLDDHNKVDKSPSKDLCGRKMGHETRTQQLIYSKILQELYPYPADFHTFKQIDGKRFYICAGKNN